MVQRRDSRGRFIAAGAEEQAGDPVAKFTEELDEATKGLGGFAKVTEQTTRGLSRGAVGALGVGAGLVGAGFAKNTAAKIGRQTVRAAGFDLLNFAATQFGAGVAGGASGNLGAADVTFSVAKGLSQNPTLAKAFALDLNLTPYLASGQRTLGITGALARLGVAPEQIAEVREATFRTVVPEEKRAAVEARAVEELTREAAGGAALAPVEAFTESLQSIPAAISKSIETSVDRAISKVMIAFGAAPSGGGGGATAGAAAGLQ